MNAEFGKLLRQYRDLNSLSQSELKDRLDTQGYHVTESALSKWENGIHVPRAEVVEVLEESMSNYYYSSLENSLIDDAVLKELLQMSLNQVDWYEVAREFVTE